jgi:hypothetical protein
MLETSHSAAMTVSYGHFYMRAKGPRDHGRGVSDPNTPQGDQGLPAGH